MSGIFALIKLNTEDAVCIRCGKLDDGTLESYECVGVSHTLCDECVDVMTRPARQATADRRMA